MLATAKYPRRLIEVDLPIASISANAHDGRSVHHGHITAIHIWWARKPLPSCRAVLLASALPDPLDEACPESFVVSAREVLTELDETPTNTRADLRARLREEVERAGAEVEAKAQDTLARFYPADDRVPIVYISFRRIRCEGPGCHADVVLTSKFVLTRREGKSVGLKLDGWNGDTPKFAIVEGSASSFQAPTVRRGAASCLRCGFTMPVERVREQLGAKAGGSHDALLVAVAVTNADGTRGFRTPNDSDRAAIDAAIAEVARIDRSGRQSPRSDAERRGDVIDREGGAVAPFPDEPLPPIGTLGFRVQRYGMTRWRDVFTPRQLLTVATYGRLVRDVLPDDRAPDGLGVAVRSCLALAVDRLADYQNTGCSWNPSGSALPHLFTRQALPIIWDFGEANPLADSSGSWRSTVDHVVKGLANALVSERSADVGIASASHHPLPTDCAHLMVTDPPYYDAIPYADLSDFFYVWLRRIVGDDHPSLFSTPLVPRDEECIVNPVAGKDRTYYRRVMTDALAEARRVTRPDGIGVVIFAHKSTSGWEDLLAAMLEAGWIITASWPIDTENATRLRARNSAVLASSIHLVCRPRERADGELITDTVGDWRSILSELPRRIEAWLPRLAAEGVVGADAIFACLGPALELFSCFARVEKVSGETVALGEYLEHVWAAVARAALSMIFADADAAPLEPDARLTAMWLWTLAGGAPIEGVADGEVDETPTSDDEDSGDGTGRYVMEFDAARKIAQGLGARLDELTSLVAVKGGTARLCAVSERAPELLGADAPAKSARRGTDRQGEMFPTEATATLGSPQATERPPEAARTTLDRLHQAMLLFSAGRGDALRRFLVDGGVGNQPAFWRLAQALAALYPPGSEEKRWVEGVLGRKRGMGFG